MLNAVRYSAWWWGRPSASLPAYHARCFSALVGQRMCRRCKRLVACLPEARRSRRDKALQETK